MIRRRGGPAFALLVAVVALAASGVTAAGGAGTDPRTAGGGPAVVAVDPPSLDFGVRAVSAPPVDRVVTFSNPGGTAYQVLTATISGVSPYYQVLTAAPFTVEPGAEVPVTVRYHAETPGTHSGGLRYTTNVLSGGPLSVPLTGVTAADGGTAQVTPNPADFGADPQGVSEDLFVRIANVGLTPLTVHSAALGGSAFQLIAWPDSIVIAGSYSYFLRVRFSRAVAGSYADTLRLVTSDPAAPQIGLPVLGVALAPPSATVDAAAIEPLDLLAGTSTSRSVVVGNVGTDLPLAVSAAIVIDAIVPDPAATPPLGEDAGGSPTVPLPQLRIDAGGHPWNVGSDGSSTGGDPGAFAFAFRNQGFPVQAEAALEDGGRTLRLGPTGGPLRYGREVHVSPSGTFVRYLETVENEGPNSVNVSLVLDSELQIDTFLFTLTSNGGGTFDPDDDWVIVHDEQAPDVVHVVAGPGGALRPSLATLTNGNRNVRYAYSFTLAPGGIGSILHYGVQAADVNEAQAWAETLRRPSGDALTGLSKAERAHILNFPIAGTFRLSTNSLQVPPGGSTEVPVLYDAVALAMDVTTTGSLRLTTNDPDQPLFVVPLSLHVTGVPPAVLDVPAAGDAPTVALAARFAPNPAVGRGLRLSFALPTAGEARFELYDVAGRRIDARVLPEAAAGPGTLEWGGGAGASGGAALAPGVYWTRLTHGGRSVVTKGVVLR